MMKPRRDAFHKLRILKYAEDIGSVVKTCRYFGVGRASFYRWKAADLHPCVPRSIRESAGW